jgi:hypothetical protein
MPGTVSEHLEVALSACLFMLFQSVPGAAKDLVAPRLVEVVGLVAGWTCWRLAFLRTYPRAYESAGSVAV